MSASKKYVFSFIRSSAVVLSQTFRNADAGGGGGKAALASLAEVGGEQTAHAAHGVDDLIAGDGVVHARQRHIGAGDGVHRADNIPLDAGDFHQTGHGVADEAQQVAHAMRVLAAPSS